LALNIPAVELANLHDADPDKARVIREFLLEVIASMTDTRAAGVPILHGEESS
jgi:hypothetical protein